GYVAQARKALGEDADDVLVTEPGGYRLQVQPGGLDLERFERSVSQSRDATARGDHALAGEHLREALSLWRGPAFGSLSFESSAGFEAERLEEGRLLALEERIDADLELGRAAELVGELRELVAEHPLRERLRGQL